MNGSRRVGLRHVIAIGVIACALAACGVKGELEAPPAANLDSRPAPAAQGQSAAPEPKVFSEQSSVQRVPHQTILPHNPPEEWTKSKQYQSTGKPKTRAKDKNDEPFFLDRIL